MKTFTIKINPEARQDIQEIIHWYNNQQNGLGRRFHSEVLERIASLKSNPYYQVRYRNVRCVNLRNFPYLIHYSVNEPEREVQIQAVFHTSRNPKIWLKR